MDKHVFIIIVGLAIALIFVGSVSGAWCNSDYAKRINVSVNNTAGSALTDYQVFVNLSSNPINETSIRVYNATGCTLRPHWCENITNGNCTKLWINYPAIAASAWTNNTAIYYDNVAVSSASNGDNTFEFFDEFDTLETGNPVMSGIPATWESSISYSNVFKIGSTYYMLYSGFGSMPYKKGLATSTDLIDWTREPSNPVLEPPGGAGWDSDNIYCGDIALVDGTYYMYHCGNDVQQIGVETSTDLINWTAYGSNPILTGTKCTPAILKEPDGITPVMFDEKYWMAYVEKSDWTVNLAYSTDLYNWTLYTGNPIFTHGNSSEWDYTLNRPHSFIKDGTNYYIFFMGRNNALVCNGLGYANSTDMYNWTKYSGNPVLTYGEPWESNHIVDPVIRKFDGTYYLFYRANGVGKIGFATASNISGPYTKYAGKWETGGTPSVSSGELLINTNDEYIRSNDTFQYKAFKARVKYPSTLINYHYFGFAASSAGSYPAEEFYSTSTPDLKVCSGQAAWTCTSAYDAAYCGSYHLYDILWKSDEAKFYIDDSLKETHTTNIMSSSSEIGFYDFGGTGDLYADWVLVRNYASPEPSTTLGSEEQGTNPTLHIGNAINIKEDWGQDFNSNLSANVTTANASNVWMNFSNAEFTNTSLGWLNLTLDEWVNESHSVNAPVTNVSVNVYLNASGAINDTDSFYYEITKRTNTATMDSAATQNVDTSETFYVNGTCNEEYGDTFLGAANLLEDGAIIDTDTSVTNYVNFSHSESSAGQYNYTVMFYNLTHYNNATTPTYSNVTVFDVMYEPPDPTALANTTGNFWVNHTWSAGSGGNVTDSFNVSVFPGWYNTTLTTYYNDSGLTSHGWSNITVWAYNNSGNGSLSTGSISDDVRIPNNIPILSGLPDNTTTEDVNQTDIFDLDNYFSDADGDTPTYLVESNNQSAYVSVTINASNNVSYTLASGWNGTASIVINITDGWSGEDNDTFLIIVNAAPLPGDYTPGDPTTLQNTTGNYWVNYTWNVGGGNATDSYNVSWNLSWFNNTLTTYMQKDVGASGWANITVYAFNSSGNGSLSTGHISDEVQAPSALPGDYPPATPTTLANTTGNGWVHYTWSSGGGANVTDSYNVSWNSTWYNTTLVSYMNDTVGEFGWANITVFAFNSSGNGSLSVGSISDETQAEGGTYTTPMGTTAYNLITYYGSTTSTAEQFGLDIGSVDYIAMYNGSFYTHTMGFSANNFTTYHGIGYYVYLNASGSSTYQRSNIPEVPYNTQLFNRWNTIGWTNSTDTNAEGVASSIGSACKYTSMLNADGITYTTHTVGFASNNHAVDKGKGYWVWTNTGLSWSRNS